MGIRRKKREEKVKGHEGTVQEGVADEKPPGLEANEESEPKLKDEEKSDHVESEHGVNEEEQRRTQEAREKQARETKVQHE